MKLSSLLKSSLVVSQLFAVSTIAADPDEREDLPRLAFYPNLFLYGSIYGKDYPTAELAAHNGAFWLGKSTTSSCNKKEEFQYCLGPDGTPVNRTIFFPIAGKQLRLYSALHNPARDGKHSGYYGQSAYIDQTDGRMRYEIPPHKLAPEDALVEGWNFDRFVGILELYDQVTPYTCEGYICENQKTKDGAYPVYFSIPSKPIPDGCMATGLQAGGVAAAYKYDG